MSAYREQTTTINDKDCLIKALKDKGYDTVEDHVEATNLIGYHGDKRQDKANIIVRRNYIGMASNDIGFRKTDNGTYEAIISDYDRGRHNAKWLEELHNHYAKHKVQKLARQQGLTPVSSSVDEKTGEGTIKYIKVTN